MKLRGAWRRDYSEFFDTQEALLIDAMDNADSIYTVFARLQSLAVKCGCAGKLLLHDSVPYTDEMLAAVTKKTVPAFRQCVQPERPGNRRDARGKPEPQSQGACKKERWEVSFREEA